MAFVKTLSAKLSWTAKQSRQGSAQKREARAADYLSETIYRENICTERGWSGVSKFRKPQAFVEEKKKRGNVFFPASGGYPIG